MEFDEIIKKRFSCRSFENKEIEMEKIESILEAVNTAPSAGNLQAYHVFVITNGEKKKEVAEAAFNQKQILEAPVVLVFFADPERSAQKYKGFGENRYSLQDATIAATFAWFKIIDLGLDAGWIGGFEENKLARILAENKKLIPAVVMPVGYCKSSQPSRKREEIERKKTILE